MLDEESAVAVVPGLGGCFRVDGVRAAFPGVTLAGNVSYVFERVLL